MMLRDDTIRLRLTTISYAAEAGAGSASALSLVLPMVGSLLQTYGVVWLLCPTPWGSTLGWPGLLGRAAAMLAVAMGAHVVAVWSNCKLFRLRVEAPVGLLILATWPAVVWMPQLVLLKRESSPLMVLVPPVIVASAVVLLRRWMDATGGADVPSTFAAGDLLSLFHTPRRRSFAVAMLPAVGTSLALQAAVAVIGMGSVIAGGWLLAAGTALPVWAYPREAKPMRLDADWRASVRAVRWRTMAVFVLLAMALVPYLRAGEERWR